ncbi:MAG TPA: acyl-CoA thioesterase/BAAT N-terminal domain-containing protein [Mycobacteriales bacterium]|nr:acyl-CoA thioesterase/BAAT N-terminal domain-containing protein [Mycobacteriales bacterium]
MLGMACAVAAGAVGCGGAAAALQVRLLIDHPVGLLDAPVRISVIGLRPGARVDVGATSDDADGRAWSSSVVFAANRAGIVDLAKMPPMAGSYSGVAPAGLLWSMSRIGGDPQTSFYALADPTRTATVAAVTVTAVVGGRIVASARLARGVLAPGVTGQVERPAKVGFYG